ncbi:MAG: glycoside hydrolase family 2 TIM barrel-domain containing protein [Ferruginibacter sp.]
MKLNRIIFFTLLFPVNISKAQQQVSLAGKWNFAADSVSVGKDQHWETKKLTGSIHLPGSTDEIKLGNYLPLFRNALGVQRPEDYPADADFGMLTRKHKYIGAAWYQKEFVVPASFKNKQAILNLERVMWRSEIWIDGKQSGAAIDHLSSPHSYNLGILEPGKHIITIRIDNREIYPIGTLAHSYCPHMQTQWNGVAGKIELVAKPMLFIENVQVFPSFKNKRVKVTAALLNNSMQTQAAKLNFTIIEKATGKKIVTVQSSKEITKGVNTVEQVMVLKQTPLPWDEFNPNLYQVTVNLSYNNEDQKESVTFGFRDIGCKDKHFTINGKKIIYRNSHEGMLFPKTGYPATDKKYWLRLFTLYKQHGLNAVRFHSACPPAAAFEAADELGLYIQAEFFWMDGWMGYKNLIGGNNDTLNNFVRQELHQALLVYGNHPSLALVAIGNELGGDFNKMSEWIAEEKKQDPRHWYAAGIAHNVTNADDYVEYGGKAGILSYPGTDWDYEANYTIAKKHNYDAAFLRKDLPEFTHETGQYVVHPLWSEINKYTGVLQPKNLQHYKAKAAANGLEKMDTAFQLASGNLNRLFYKAEIEATLRTKQSAGYALLGMVDYPGQGEALMGWVDPFYKNKIFISPGQFSKYGTHTVPLLRFAKYVWQDGDTFDAAAEVANFSNKQISQASIHYTIREKNKIIKEAYLPAVDLLQGEVTIAGNFSFPLQSGDNGRQLNISVDIAGTSYRNDWDIWVFPKPAPVQNKEVFITGSIDTAVIYLDQGKKVLLQADNCGSMRNKSYACFSPVFWSGTWFYEQESEVLGAVIQKEHPALKLFPTNAALDWQWQDLCDKARGFILNDLPKNYRPIIQPVDDYHFGNQLGSLFELKTNNGGQLLVCGYNLTVKNDRNIQAAQLKRSLLNYMQSAAFKPATIVNNEWLTKTFANKDKLSNLPEQYKNALIYVKAGGDHPLKEGEAEWEKAVDQSYLNSGFDYTVNCTGVIKSDEGTGWSGKKMTIDLKVPAASLMMLKLRFEDWGKKGRAGEIQCEDIPVIKLGSHENGEWITIPVTRENCLDGKLQININTSTKRDLIITDMMLEPAS